MAETDALRYLEDELGNRSKDLIAADGNEIDRQMIEEFKINRVKSVTRYRCPGVSEAFDHSCDLRWPKTGRIVKAPVGKRRFPTEHHQFH
jgi:hypothetical protein